MSASSTLPSLQRGIQYHVFLAHAAQDSEFADRIANDLIGKGYSVVKSAIIPGNSNFCNKIKKCHRVLHLITPSYRKEEFEIVEVEALMAIRERGCPPISVFLKTEDILSEKLPDYHAYQHYAMTYKKSDHNYSCEQLHIALSREEAQPSLGIDQFRIPVGKDLAHGLAWSYYYGYLRLILPGLEERIRKSDIWTHDDRHISKKLFILMPRSCLCPPSLDKCFEKTKFYSKLEPFKAHRSGNIARTYHNTLYKVTNSDGETYYFAGELATPLLSMYEMANGRLADMIPEDLDGYARAFFLKLCEILSAPEAGECNGHFYIHYYDDKIKDYEKCFEDDFCLIIEKEIQKELKIEKEGAWSIEKRQPINTLTVQEVRDFEQADELGKYEYHAFLTYAEEDSEMVQEIQDRMEKHNFKFLNHKADFVIGTSVVKNMERAVTKSKKFIHFITEAYLRSNFTQFEVTMTQERMRREGKQLSIYIVHGVPTARLPDYVRSVTFIPYKPHMELNLLIKRLCKDLNGDIKLADTLPVGNISTGLAWSYFHGYLKDLLPEIPSTVEKCDKFQKDPAKRKIAKRLFIIVPQSARTPKQFCDVCKNIKTLSGALQSQCRDVSGVKGRQFHTSLHEITTSRGEVYYFVGEFASSLRTVHSMEQSQIAGMSTEEKHKQTNLYYLKLMDILHHDQVSGCKNTFYIHMFNDEDEQSMNNFADDLVDKIKQEIQKDLHYETPMGLAME